MGVLKKASDNFDGIVDGIGNLLETQRSIENNRALKTMAYGSPNKLDDIEQMLLAEQQIQILQSQSKGATRRYNILKDPELNKQIQAKRIELLEKTGTAVPIDDIIDVYFGHLNEDGLNSEEEEELAAIQKQFEDEEEAKVDAEMAEQEQKQEELEERRMQKMAESQPLLIATKNIIFIFLAILLIVLLVLLFVVPGN